MYASIRHWRLEQGDMDEAMHRADEQFADRLAEQDGFVAYECVQCADDELITMSIFRDREGAERSAELAREFVRDSLSDMEISSIAMQEGDVRVSRAAREVLEPAHA